MVLPTFFGPPHMCAVCIDFKDRVWLVRDWEGLKYDRSRRFRSLSHQYPTKSHSTKMPKNAHIGPQIWSILSIYQNDLESLPKVRYTNWKNSEILRKLRNSEPGGVSASLPRKIATFKAVGKTKMWQKTLLLWSYNCVKAYVGGLRRWKQISLDWFSMWIWVCVRLWSMASLPL